MGGPDDKVFGYTNVTKVFSNAVKKAGLETNGPRKVTRHTMRHTCSTWLAEEGVPIATTAKQMGQKIETAAKYYQHAGDLHEAVARIAGKRQQSDRAEDLRHD